MKNRALGTEFANVAALAAGLLCGLGHLAAGAVEGERADLVNRQVLRVCADPANMPFSNEKGEGFENKIAAIVADELGMRDVEYTWFPQVIGFVRRTLFEKRCDVIVGYAQGDELVLNTNAYYRSSYVLLYRKGQGLDGVDRLADPRLKGKRVGLMGGTPPGDILAKEGLMTRAKAYPLMVDRRYFSPAEEMIKDIRSGEIDAGILWGPIAGYYAARGGEPLAVVPLANEAPGPRMSFRITMGVRQGDDSWKRRLNEVLAKRQAEITSVLLSYDVPLLDERNNLITAVQK